MLVRLKPDPTYVSFRRGEFLLRGCWWGLAQIPCFVWDRQAGPAAFADADVHVSGTDREDHFIRQADRAARDQLAGIGWLDFRHQGTVPGYGRTGLR